MALKFMMIDSITRSSQIIGTKAVLLVKSTVNAPKMLDIANKSVLELRSLKISQVQWWSNGTLGFTLNDGQSCKAGTFSDLIKTHVFSEKINKIEVIIDKYEERISEINFHCQKQELVKLRWSYDAGRKVVFEISADEQLIGCELHKESNGNFRGLTWLKMRMIKF